MIDDTQPTMRDYLQALLGSDELKALWANESAWRGYVPAQPLTGYHVQCIAAKLPAYRSRPTTHVVLGRYNVTLAHSPGTASVHLHPRDGWTYYITQVDASVTLSEDVPLSAHDFEDIRRAFGDLLVWGE